MERHVIRLAYRIPLPYPNNELYTRIYFPKLTQHIAELCRSYTEKCLVNNNDIFITTVCIDLEQNVTHKYCHKPPNELLSLYIQHIPPDHHHTVFFQRNIINEHMPGILPY